MAELTQLRQKLDKAKEKLAIAKADHSRLLKDLRQSKTTTVEQAREKAETLRGEAEKLDQEAGTLLDRASKLLERFE
jgi:predicted nuclease with TOPRIM domain